MKTLSACLFLTVALVPTLVLAAKSITPPMSKTQCDGLSDRWWHAENIILGCSIHRCPPYTVVDAEFLQAELAEDWAKGNCGRFLTTH